MRSSDIHPVRPLNFGEIEPCNFVDEIRFTRPPTVGKWVVTLDIDIVFGLEISQMVDLEMVF
jgi:hypothetical protein